jgi:outer membrane protein assembly factor BamB
MKRQNFFIFISMALSLCVTSCPLFFDQLFPKPGGRAVDNGHKGYLAGEPRYEKEVVWSTELDFFTDYGNPFTDGKYGYYAASNFQKKDLSCIIKLDFETGAIIWTTLPIAYTRTASPFKIGRYVYLPVNNGGEMYVYHDDSGALAATVRFGPDETSAKNNGSISRHTAVFGNYVFWCNSLAPYDARQGLMRFNVESIDFSKVPSEPQVVEPHLIWERRYNEKNPIAIWTNIAVENGLVYFLTISSAYFNPDWVSHLVALDAKTGEEQWDRAIVPVKGDRFFSLVLDGEQIRVLDFAPCSYNKADGSVIYENDYRDVDITREGYRDASSGLKGATLYNGRLYFTSGQHDGYYREDPPPKPGSVANILCLDPNTGNLIWGALTPGDGTVNTFPLVYNGKVYIVVPSGLRVFDAETGELLGVDRSVFNLLGAWYNFLYQDMFIFADELFYDSDKIKITAIRCK